MPKKTRGTSSVQARVQEFVKKLHPAVLRSRLRSFRQFVITTNGEKKPKKEESTSSHHTAFVQPTFATESKIVAPSRVVKRERVSNDSRKTQPIVCSTGQFSCDDDVDLKIMEGTVPDVIVQHDENTTKSNANENRLRCDTASVASNNLQLLVDVENPPRNKSPVTVQEWVDSLPVNPVDASRDECDVSVSVAAPAVDTETDNLTLGAEAGCLCDSKETVESLPSPPVNVTITSCREPSEVESHCSSVDSLLEARKPDPEEILLSLGFGGSASTSYLETGRIPKRFLSPSQMKGVDIEEFIRQQQDLIYTYESGYYGYRGLAGPSHSNPSVIVAKILEKLRDHEKGTALMNCFPPDFRKLSLADPNAENDSKKFSKIARNVLTKIRCTPGSVLSPDNRRWLDSQGNKSPEINRRLILGQKSFTFGNDGALIEASNTCSNDSKNEELPSSPRDSNIIDESPVSDNVSRIFSNSDENASHLVDIVFAGNDVNALNKEHIDNVNQKSLSVENPSEMSNAAVTSGINENIDNDTNSASRLSDFNAYSSMSAERFKFAVSLPECESHALANCHPEIGSSPVNLKEFCEKNQSSETDLSSSRKPRNVLTRCSSFEESVKSNSDDEVLLMPRDVLVDTPSIAEKFDQFSDSATESEFASYPDRTPFSKNIHKQYEELSQLESKLRNVGQPIPIISEDQFASITTEQRTALQLSIVREALKIYLHQLTEDEINLELKNCLTVEAQKVADLLDSSSDSSKLCVIVRQMTLLLQHQSQLSAQIKELSNVGNKPSSCHEMCEHILKRVHELESLVKQNAEELAHMKCQLLNKK